MGIIDINWVSEYDRLLKQKLAEVDAVLNAFTALDLTVDIVTPRLTLKSGNDTYFVNLTKIVAPNLPTIDVRTKYIVSGNAKFQVGNVTRGSVVRWCYAMQDDDSWGEYSNWELLPEETASIDIPTGFSPSHTQDNAFNVRVKFRAVMNGITVETAENQAIILTITPKVAPPTITEVNYSQYANTYVVRFAPSATVGATTLISTDGGIHWEAINELYQFTTSDSTINSNRFQAKAQKDNYGDSDIAKMPTTNREINKKKSYYGYNVSGQLADINITGLSNSIAAGKPAFNTNYTITNSDRVDAYLWICCPEELIASDSEFRVRENASADPLSSSTVHYIGNKGGYNCYRIDEAHPSNDLMNSMYLY